MTEDEREAIIQRGIDAQWTNIEAWWNWWWGLTWTENPVLDIVSAGTMRELSHLDVTKILDAVGYWEMRESLDAFGTLLARSAGAHPL